MCSLHVHAPVKVPTLHAILISTLRRPQPNSGRPYVEFPEDQDINAIVFHGSGSLIQSANSPVDESYKFKSSGVLSIHKEVSNWSRDKVLDTLRCVLHIVGQEAPTSPSAAAWTVVESQVKTVGIRFLDIDPNKLPNWLSFVSLPDTC
jgi:hypothetical protein